MAWWSTLPPSRDEDRGYRRALVAILGRCHLASTQRGTVPATQDHAHLGVFDGDLRRPRFASAATAPSRSNSAATASLLGQVVPIGETVTAQANSKDAMGLHIPATIVDLLGLAKDESAVAHHLVARAGRVAGIAHVQRGSVKAFSRRSATGH